MPSERVDDGRGIRETLAMVRLQAIPAALDPRLEVARNPIRYIWRVCDVLMKNASLMERHPHLSACLKVWSMVCKTITFLIRRFLSTLVMINFD